MSDFLVFACGHPQYESLFKGPVSSAPPTILSDEIFLWHYFIGKRFREKGGSGSHSFHPRRDACACTWAVAIRLLHASTGGRVRRGTFARSADLSAYEAIQHLDWPLFDRGDCIQSDFCGSPDARRVVSSQFGRSRAVCNTLVCDAAECGPEYKSLNSTGVAFSVASAKAVSRRLLFL